MIWFGLVVGNQERRVKYKTRLSKEGFRQRRDNSENIQDHWAMELGKGLLAIQYAGFQLGWSSKALDLKDDSVT